MREPRAKEKAPQRSGAYAAHLVHGAAAICADGLIIIIIVMPRSRMVSEMKPHAWADVHRYARAMVASPIANVVLVNITTVV
jgi:hypothetical protein